MGIWGTGGGYRDLLNFREKPLYTSQKALSNYFWMMSTVGWPPRNAFGICAVCVVTGYRQVWTYAPPEHHHLIVPRNYTRDRDKTVNWWWNLVPVHSYGCHLWAHGHRDELILELAERVSRDYLQVPDWEIQAGLDWLREQIELEGLVVHVSLPGVGGDNGKAG